MHKLTDQEVHLWMQTFNTMLNKQLFDGHSFSSRLDDNGNTIWDLPEVDAANQAANLSVIGKRNFEDWLKNAYENIAKKEKPQAEAE